LRSRKDTGAISDDKTILTIKREADAMCCCQIPPDDGVRTTRRETVDSSASTWMWVCLIAGVTFLSLSLATGIWVAVTV
jgi:hypothetical protein